MPQRRDLKFVRALDRAYTRSDARTHFIHSTLHTRTQRFGRGPQVAEDPFGRGPRWQRTALAQVRFGRGLLRQSIASLERHFGRGPLRRACLACQTCNFFECLTCLTRQTYNILECLTYLTLVYKKRRGALSSYIN